MEDAVKLPLLERVLPDGLRFGANYVIEFEPQSLWHETSLTLCAQSLRLGVKTDYHSFTHPPEDIRRQLNNMGIDVARFEVDDTFRIVDSYKVQTGTGPADRVGRTTTLEWGSRLKSVKMGDWDEGSIRTIRSEVPEIDKRRLHVDDDTSVLVKFNDETSVVEHFRTLTLPFARHLELAALHSMAAGIYSDAFYKQFESFCDGVVDFRAREEGERIGHYMRFRVARGASHDSGWKRLELGEKGEVKMASEEGREFEIRGSDEGSSRGLRPLDQSERVERRLAAIMFTDVEGFTAMAQRNERLALESLEGQRRLVRPLLAKHKGREVKTMGDAFLVEFGSSLDAVTCAVEIQKAMMGANEGLPADRRLLIRIGVHLGDVIHSGPDVEGDAVNIASRIEPLAAPGGICVTAPVQASVQNKVPLEFESLGTPRLKNVIMPIEVFRVVGFGEPKKKVLQEPPRTSRVAVLPLSNISLDKADEYFSEGLTEELISSISRTQGLRVIARTSVMKYKGSSKPASEIGRELGVGNLLEGSVRKSGDKVRITVQLVDVASEEPKWSQEYDRELSDIFTIQSDIARRVAEALRIHVLGVPMATQPTTSGAYVSYLRGRQAWNRRNEEGLRQAVGFFGRALAEDERYAKAYTGLADSYATLALLELSPPREVYPKAKEAAGKALSLDPQLAEAHTSLGLIRFQYDWDWNGAEEEFREAIRLNPSYAPAHHFFADYLKAMGRFEEALSEISRAQELDPLNLAINTGAGHVLYLSRQYDRAIEQYKKAVELDPSFMLTRIWFGRPYLEKGMYSEAISELETAVKLSGESTLALAMLGHGLASAGRKAEAEAVLARLMERSKSQYVPSYWVAVVYNGFRDREDTMAWLKRAFDERSSWLVWTNVEPRFDWLRNDREFASMIGAMKFP